MQETAARSLRDPHFVKSKLQAQYQTRAPKEPADAYIVWFYQAFHKECETRGIPVYAHEFYRSPERQYELHRAGHSKARAGTSPHNSGLAVDIVHSVHHWNLNPDEWDLLGAIGKECARKLNIQVEWGGDWDFYDPAHWQLKNWRAIRDNEWILPFCEVPPEQRGVIKRTARKQALVIASQFQDAPKPPPESRYLRPKKLAQDILDYFR